MRVKQAFIVSDKIKKEAKMCGPGRFELTKYEINARRKIIKNFLKNPDKGIQRMQKNIFDFPFYLVIHRRIKN